MKKIILTVGLLIGSVLSANAQSNSDRYFIGAFNPLSESQSIWKDGLNRIDNEDIAIFFITNRVLQYRIAFNHFSHLKKSTDPIVLDMPIAKLENMDNIVSATELLNFKDADSAYNWMADIFPAQIAELNHHNEVRTKIYVIDTNKFYKSNPALEEPDMMKVIEVRIWAEDIPDHILNTM